MNYNKRLAGEKILVRLPDADIASEVVFKIDIEPRLPLVTGTQSMAINGAARGLSMGSDSYGTYLIK